MITNADARKISGNIQLEHEKYTVTDGNLIKLVQQAICAYKNPNRSVVREYAVNGRDAMKLHNITKPIEVVTPTMLSPKLTIRDYGGGMTEEETRDLLFSFGASGKEKQVSNRYVGGFGIGSKSAFNLTDTFLFTVFHKGTATTWQCMLDKENFPTAAKVSSVPTTEEDGVLVQIPIKTRTFDESEAYDALKWLDVPVLLNGKPVESYKSKSRMSGTVKIKNADGETLDVNWDIVGENQDDDVVFVIGCGAIALHLYRMPADVYNHVSMPAYFNKRLIIELPVGSATLMTSREDFVYNDRTNHVLREAMKAAIESIYDRIGEYICGVKNLDDVIERLTNIRKTYDRYGFETMVGKASERLRTVTTAEEVKDRICREIELGEASGVYAMHVAVPVRAGRYSYSEDFRYKTSDVSRESFIGNVSDYNGLTIWKSLPGNYWNSSYVEEFSELVKYGTGETAKILVYRPSRELKNGKPTKPAKVVFEAVGWQNLEVQLFPMNTRRFVGEIRAEVKKAGAVNKHSKIIIFAMGDLDVLRPQFKKMFPGATIRCRTDVATFKYRLHAIVSDKEEKKPVNRRRLYGWIASVGTRHGFPKTPEDIVRTMTSNGTDFNFTSKTSFADFEGAEKPIFSVSVQSIDAKNDESFRRNLKMKITLLMLSGVDVVKSENGFPIVALLESGETPPADVPFADEDDMMLKTKKPDEDTQDRYAMWLYRMLVGDMKTDKYGGIYVPDMSSYVYGTGLRTYDERSSRIKVCAPLLERVIENLAKRRLDPAVRAAVNNLKRLFTRPGRLPYIKTPKFSHSFSNGESPFVMACKELTHGIPAASVVMRHFTPYDYSKQAYIEELANNLAVLICEKRAHRQQAATKTA